MIAPTEILFIAGAIFIAKSRDGACAGYYSGKLWFDHVSGRLLFRLPEKILDVLTYLRLYKIRIWIGTDQVYTALAVNRCAEVVWDKTATRDGLAGYNFTTGELLLFGKKGPYRW